MNREIKFKLWDKDNKEMSIGISLEHFITREGPDIEFPISDGTLPLNDLVTYINDFIFLQYTNCKDSNETEIYDLDILGIGHPYADSETIGIVKFDPDMATFIVEKTNGAWDYLYSFLLEYKEAAILGNKFEHPELFKED